MLVHVNETNIETEHICCAISEKKGENCVGSKKDWLKKRFRDGLVFTKLDVRGKVFIEYIPAKSCFAPIFAPNYMFINCLWVSGKFKGQGHSSTLLDSCIRDAKAKGMSGLVTLGSKKKMHFLTDPKFLKYKGFMVADTANSGFELLYLPFDDNDTPRPQFNACVKSGTINKKHVVIYYSNGCPHTDKYVPIGLNYLKSLNIKAEAIKIETTADAQASPTPFTIYSVFMNGQFVTTEVLTEKKWLKYLQEYEMI